MPWIDATIKQLVKKRHKLYLRARKSKDPDVKIHYKRFRAHVQKVLRDARVLKECSNEISPILALIYNESLAQGDVPDDRRQANAFPVFKQGEKYDAANYRPVSLTCICCKTLEHILVSNINKHLALYSILADCQHGFRSQRYCETQLVQFVHDIISNLDGLWIVGTNRQI